MAVAVGRVDGQDATVVIGGARREVHADAPRAGDREIRMLEAVLVLPAAQAGDGGVERVHQPSFGSRPLDSARLTSLPPGHIQYSEL